MIIALIISILLAAAGVSYALYAKSRTEKINKYIRQKNQDLKIENAQLETSRNLLASSNKQKSQEHEQLIENIKIAQSELNGLTHEQQKSKSALEKTTAENRILQEQNEYIKQQHEQTLETFHENWEKQKGLVQEGFATYCEFLEQEYQNKDEEYDQAVLELGLAYEKMHDGLIEKFNAQKDKIAADLDQARRELDKIRATRVAALEAQQREEKLQNERAFYSLSIDKKYYGDIAILNEVAPRLADDRPLKMAMWSAYYLKPSNDLASRVMGGRDKITGVYKITNPDLGLCYIGQAVDVKSRWRDHQKHGLGIDTPSGNKLYAAMERYGLEAFTFELVEECAAAELNEKEKYYIELYDAYEHGWNGTRGNKT